MKSNKGVTLISVIMTIILMGIIAGIMLANVVDYGTEAVDTAHNVANTTNEVLYEHDDDISDIKEEISKSYR